MAYYDEGRYPDRAHADPYGNGSWRVQRRHEEPLIYQDTYHSHYPSEDPYRQTPGAKTKRPRSTYGEKSPPFPRPLPPAPSRGSAHGRGRPTLLPPRYEPYPAPHQRPPPPRRAPPPAYDYDRYAADYWRGYEAEDYDAYSAVHNSYAEEEEHADAYYYRAPVPRRRASPRRPPHPVAPGRGRFPPRYTSTAYDRAPYQATHTRSFEARPGMKHTFSSFAEDISLEEATPNLPRGGARGRGSRGRGQGRGRGRPAVAEEGAEEENKPRVTDPLAKLQKFHEELPRLKKQAEVVRAVDLAARQADIEVVQVYVQVEPGKPKSPIRVDVFFEDRFIASGQGADKPAALLAAYKNILVSSEWQDLPSLVSVSRRLVLEDRKQPGFQHIVCRTISHDETNNLNVLKNLRLYPVDFTIKLEDVVLIVEAVQDWEAVEDQALCSRYMQNSLSANGLYIAWQVSRGKDSDYHCKMFVQKELLATASGASVQAAKHKAATSGFKFLAKSQDILIYMPRLQCSSPELAMEELVQRAVEKRNAFYQTDDKELDLATPDGQKWMGKVFEEILEEFCGKIGLEALNIKGKPDFPFQEKMLEMLWARGLTVGSHTMTGVKHFTISRRPKRSPQEIAIILRLCGGKSGRYELAVSNKTVSPERLELAKQQFFANETVTG